MYKIPTHGKKCKTTNCVSCLGIFLNSVGTQNFFMPTCLGTILPGEELVYNICCVLRKIHYLLLIKHVYTDEHTIYIDNTKDDDHAVSIQCVYTCRVNHYAIQVGPTLTSQ